MAFNPLTKGSADGFAIVAAITTIASVVATLKTKSPKPLILMLIPVSLFVIQNHYRSREEDYIYRKLLGHYYSGPPWHNGESRKMCKKARKKRRHALTDISREFPTPATDTPDPNI